MYCHLSLTTLRLSSHPMHFRLRTLVILLWPAMVAGRVVGKSKTRGLLYVAVAVAFIQPLINGAAAQRLD